MARKLAASLLALAFPSFGACASWAEESGHIDPVGAPVVPIARDEKLPVTTTPPSSQSESRIVGVLQGDPPESCFGTDQPAIVQVQDDGTGTRRPVWMCREGCAPGFELVTTAYTGRRRHSSKEYTTFTPTCEAWCPSGMHRISYVLDASASADNSCAPGPTPASSLDTRAREEDRRVAATLDAWRAEFASIAEGIARAESATEPWNEAARVAWADADERLKVVEGGLRKWFAHGREISRIGENYRRVDEEIARKARDAFLTRVQSGLPRDVKERVAALRTRVDRLRPRAERASAQATEERERAAAREQEDMERAIRARSHADCVDSCQRELHGCMNRCTALTQAACEACTLAESRCQAACNAR